MSHGTQTTDLDVNAVIASTAGEGLTKAGSGGLELDKNNTYTGMTNITSGNLEVDGAIGDVTLNGVTAGVSGVGNVGTILIGVAGGTINPGANNSANPVGVLTSTPSAANGNTDTFSPATTFSVDLLLADGGLPAPPHDQLVVNGGISLGGATLTGNVATNLAPLTNVTIIQATGTVTPKLAEPSAPSIAFINGRKFTVTYNPQSVVLRLVIISTHVVLAAATPNPSSLGQPVSFTATVSALAPSTADPTSGTVNFYDGSNPIPIGSGPVGNNHQAVLTISTLQGGTHSITAVYQVNPPDYNASPPSSSVSQVVLKNPTITVTPSTTTPVFGQPTTYTVLVSDTPANAAIPSGTVSLSVDGTPLPPPNPMTLGVTTGQAVFSGVNLGGLGSHTISVTYSGDTVFAATGTTMSQSVGQANTTATLTVTPPNAVFGQPVTFTATIAAALPSTAAAPTAGTVSFFDGGNLIGTAQNVTSGGLATITTTTLAGGAHTITAKYNGDNASYAASPTVTLAPNYQVNPAPTAVQLTSSQNPAGNSQPVTFTATVTAQGPSTINPASGSVQFYDGATGNPANVIGTTTHTNSSNVFTLITSSLTGSGSPHSITAVYVANSNYLGSSSNTISQAILKIPTITITPSTSTPVFGQPMTYTVVVSDTPASASVPSGTVSLSLDGTPLPPATPNPMTLDVTGQAVFSGVSLGGLGSHTIAVSYSGDSTFNPAGTTISQTVGKANTTATLSASPLGPPNAVYGQPVTITATVATALPSTAAAPTAGTVSFFDGGNLIGTAQNVSSGSLATITTTSLAGGSHIITTKYNGDNISYAASPTVTLTPNYQVDPAATGVQLTSSQNPSGSAQPVTFTATVTAQGLSTINPTGGSVQFYDGATSNPANLIGTTTHGTSNNLFTLITSSLTSSASPHNITAVYVANSNYCNFGSSSNTVSQTIIKSPTITITPSTSTPVFGQPMSYTVLVSDTPASAAIPSGTVSLSVDGTPLPSATPNPMTLDVTGQAVFSGVSLGGVDAHTISRVLWWRRPVLHQQQGSVTADRGHGPHANVAFRHPQPGVRAAARLHRHGDRVHAERRHAAHRRQREVLHRRGVSRESDRHAGGQQYRQRPGYSHPRQPRAGGKHLHRERRFTRVTVLLTLPAPHPGTISNYVRGQSQLQHRR